LHAVGDPVERVLRGAEAARSAVERLARGRRGEEPARGVEPRGRLAVASPGDGVGDVRERGVDARLVTRRRALLLVVAAALLARPDRGELDLDLARHAALELGLELLQDEPRVVVRAVAREGPRALEAAVEVGARARVDEREERLDALARRRQLVPFLLELA